MNLRRCRFAVYCVFAIAMTWALSLLVLGATTLITSVRAVDVPALLDPLSDSLRSLRRGEAVSGTTAIVKGVCLLLVAFVFRNYARRLREASAGSTSDETLLSAQTKCWFLVALLAMLLFARFILEQFGIVIAIGGWQI